MRIYIFIAIVVALVGCPLPSDPPNVHTSCSSDADCAKDTIGPGEYDVGMCTRWACDPPNTMPFDGARMPGCVHHAVPKGAPCTNGDLACSGVCPDPATDMTGLCIFTPDTPCYCWPPEDVPTSCAP